MSQTSTDSCTSHTYRDAANYDSFSATSLTFVINPTTYEPIVININLSLSANGQLNLAAGPATVPGSSLPEITRVTDLSEEELAERARATKMQRTQTKSLESTLPVSAAMGKVVVQSDADSVTESETEPDSPIGRLCAVHNEGLETPRAPAMAITVEESATESETEPDSLPARPSTGSYTFNREVTRKRETSSSPDYHLPPTKRSKGV